MATLRFVTISATLLFLHPMIGFADPVLLRECTGTGGSGPNTIRPEDFSAMAIPMATFSLFYGFLGANQCEDPTPTGCPLNEAIIYDLALGFSPLFAPGETGTFDFNSSNTPNFDLFVARLTNGLDATVVGFPEGLAHGFIALNDNGELTNGSTFHSIPESVWFQMPTPTDLGCFFRQVLLSHIPSSAQTG